MPGFGDQALQALGNPLTLARGQIAMILRRQLRGDGIVFLDQGAPRHFGRVGCQHQLDIQASDLARQRVGVVSVGQQALQQLGQHARLERLRLIGATPADAMVLLGDIGQVEELVEGPRHRQQLIVIELIEGGVELFGTGRRSPSRSLGALTDAFDLGQEVCATLRADGVAQQLAELMNVLAQTRVDFRHD
ncbi:hypothetical protein D9M68_811720 [compost metagenome]